MKKSRPYTYCHIPFYSRRLIFFGIFGMLATYSCKNEDFSENETIPDIAINSEIAQKLEAFEGRGALTDESDPVPAEEAIQQFSVAHDLEMDVVLDEPMVNQPLEISFDGRGRMWVVHYNQYPYPKGLKITGLDNHLRLKFDTIPQPPPEGLDGADRISVFEDTDGDGSFDTSTEAITGLNIATSVALGRGRIWVLNPPYLLSYPDKDGDGIPDGDPEVCLQGFGLEDTHAVANSLRWGPDGWLYGAQGSTTTANISSEVTKNVAFQGQAIWRYHPYTKVFEIYAEGGGNTFNVEIDSQGRIYSGNNGSGRGPYYKQGAYYGKSWGKHGPLTNPYAFGFLDDMELEGDNVRFTHSLLRYEGGNLPDRYEENIIALNPLQGNILLSDIEKNGSSLKTVDNEIIIDTEDRWFRPIDIQAGPDGHVYVSDWYDSRLSHVDPRDTWVKTSGRIYRIRGKGSQRGYKPINLYDKTSKELVGLLKEDNRWYRQKALQILGDRKDRSVIAELKSMFITETGQAALEALWAIHLIQGLDDDIVLQGLQHNNPVVRTWTVRLVGDGRQASEKVARALARMSSIEPNVETRSQLAASAKRLPGVVAIPILEGLLLNHEDLGDPDIALQIWWAFESKAEPNRELISALLENRKVWGSPIMTEHILSRLMQRYILAGGEDNYRTSTRLFNLAPGDQYGEFLMNGLQEGLRGKTLTELPGYLIDAMNPYRASGEGEWAMALRQKDQTAFEKAIKIIKNQDAALNERLSYIRILGEQDYLGAVPVLLDLLKRAVGTESKAIKTTALKSLQRYDSKEIGEGVLGAYPRILREDKDLRLAALNLLISRPGWTKSLLDEIENTMVIHATDVPTELVVQMKNHNEKPINRRIEKIWPSSLTSPEDKTRHMKRLADVIQTKTGDKAAGKLIYQKACGVCHRMYEEGGDIGPDLTGYDRSNLSYLLVQIVDPDAEIREGYVNYLIRTKDGRTLSGFLTSRSDKTITIKPYGGTEISLSMEEIEEMEPQKTSLMPEGILEKMSDKEVQDLFAFIMSNGKV